MRDQTTQNKNPNEMVANGSAKLAHKIFVHRLIFNWNFFNGFNVYIKLIYIFFFIFAWHLQCCFRSHWTLLFCFSLFFSHSIWRMNFAQSSSWYLLVPLPRIAILLLLFTLFHRYLTVIRFLFGQFDSRFIRPCYCF